MFYSQKVFSTPLAKTVRINMATSKTYSGNLCGSGVLVSFPDINLNIGENYTVSFSSVSRMPDSSYSIVPTGFTIKPSSNNST